MKNNPNKILNLFFLFIKAIAKNKHNYQIPEQFNEGYILKDCFKATWTLIKPIGQGGFGLIYLGKIAVFLLTLYLS